MRNRILKIRDKLIEHGLKVTPQRIAIYEAIVNLKNHPTADKIFRYTENENPSISPGTVYKTLETFASAGLINKIKTDKDIMRYDAVLEKHHHIYCEDTGEILDYNNEDLNHLLEKYFSEHKIPGFRIKDINLQITGEKTNQ